MTKKLKVAVIGTGMIARAGHVPAWKNLSEQVEVVGVAGTDRERTERFARTEGVPQAYTDWQKMITETKPDLRGGANRAVHRQEQGERR